MFRQTSYMENVSLRLSEVLSDIGVNERIVLKRRRSCLLTESIRTQKFKLQLGEISIKCLLLGSQSEGTTTIDLKSDVDTLLCHEYVNVIQYINDWEPGVKNYLMIQDETVSPGYCLLQRLRDDAPLPYNYVPNEHFVQDRSGRIHLKNTMISYVAAVSFIGEMQSGPAYAMQGRKGIMDSDHVGSFHCKTWPTQARQWLGEQGDGQGLLGDISSTGCFVVGVGVKGSENEELEWRISTSVAERCLMFNLNITQIRCYVLMKMILKTFFNQPPFSKTISSFMCKTILFHCKINTHSGIWKENHLLLCLSMCLCELYKCISNDNCPHFFIPGNNLMQGKIPRELKPYILQILQNIVESEGRALLEIECDNLGERLNLKLISGLSIDINDQISGKLLVNLAHVTEFHATQCLGLIGKQQSFECVIQTLLQFIVKLVHNSRQKHGLDKTASCLLASRFCATLGSTLASISIQQHDVLTTEVLTWITLGLNKDAASCKLKLASMLYCIRDFHRTDIVLRNIERNSNLHMLESVCTCYDYIKQSKAGFDAECDKYNEEAIQFITASCVKFLPCEINCIPPELKFEMFRSTKEDLAFRGEDDYWMDWAVVDSVTFLFFLQYKNNNRLRRFEEKQMALSNLLRTVAEEPNLGHRETALNLLGQCMEKEHRTSYALRFYVLSLRLRERNNAAKFHICRLLSKIICNRKTSPFR